MTSMIDSLVEQETTRADVALAEFQNRLRTAETLDRYRTLLNDNDADDIDGLRELMQTLKLTVDDVKSDAEAMAAYLAAQADLLDDERRAAADAAHVAAFEQVRDETARAVAKLWKELPAEIAVRVYREIEVRSSKPGDVNAWASRLRAADNARQQKIQADRRARQAVAELTRQHPRVLGNPLPTAEAEPAAAGS